MSFMVLDRERLCLMVFNAGHSTNKCSTFRLPWQSSHIGKVLGVLKRYECVRRVWPMRILVTTVSVLLWPKRYLALWHGPAVEALSLFVDGSSLHSSFLFTYIFVFDVPFRNLGWNICFKHRGKKCFWDEKTKTQTCYYWANSTFC